MLLISRLNFHRNPPTRKPTGPPLPEDIGFTFEMERPIDKDPGLARELAERGASPSLVEAIGGKEALKR